MKTIIPLILLNVVGRGRGSASTIFHLVVVVWRLSGVSTIRESNGVHVLDGRTRWYRNVGKYGLVRHDCWLTFLRRFYRRRSNNILQASSYFDYSRTPIVCIHRRIIVNKPSRGISKYDFLLRRRILTHFSHDRIHNLTYLFLLLSKSDDIFINRRSTDFPNVIALR